MSKSHDERITDTVGVIRDICGDVDAREVLRWLAGKSDTQRKAISESLSIGYAGSSSDVSVKRLRAVKRALVLASQALPGQQAIGFSSLDGGTFFTLADRLRKMFPFRARPLLGNFDGRSEWAFCCTDPKQHDPRSFRYIVHGIMAAPSRLGQYTEFGGKVSNEDDKKAYEAAKKKFSGNPDMLVETQTGGGSMKTFNLNAKFFVQYLRNPDVLKSVIISTSLIDAAHVATYYPFGFILNVPAANVYSASPRDQSVANRTDNILEEFQRIFNSDNVGNRILSPKQVLDQTSHAQGKLGYNEIVVVGTSPEGLHVSVSGLFVKVDAAGCLWVDPLQKTPYVTLEVAQLVNELASARGLPIVGIVDTMGGAATQPIRARNYFENIVGI